jgi:hypothetical protein
MPQAEQYFSVKNCDLTKFISINCCFYKASGRPRYVWHGTQGFNDKIM